MSNLMSFSHRAIGSCVGRIVGILPDCRLRFADLSAIASEERQAGSAVLQFYSPVDNIGNYTSVLGIHEMLGFVPDVWSCHSCVDWDFVNKNYKLIIIGGAGLLHGVFNSFWKDVSEQCEVPVICWGIGACFPRSARDKTEPASREYVNDVFDRALLVDLRDQRTVDYYGCAKATICFCPTAAWVRSIGLHEPAQKSKGLLLVEHLELVPDQDISCRRRLLKDSGYNFRFAGNVQTRRHGVLDIVQNMYWGSSTIVTTRLHGAIIGRSMNLPVIVSSYDDKLDAFVNEWRGAVIAQNDAEVIELLNAGQVPCGVGGDEIFKSMYALGEQASEIIKGL
jgi:hypothetical protein